MLTRGQSLCSPVEGAGYQGTFSPQTEDPQHLSELPDEHQDQSVSQENSVTEQIQEASSFPAAPVGRMCE